jgi:hypothetical protein
MKVLFLLLLVALSMSWTESRFIEFENRCGYDIWVNPLTNAQGPPLPGGIRRLRNYERYSYQIPDGGWGGRFWPKSGCDDSGQMCEVGQSVDPCNPGGCDPPAETKVEFFFPPVGDPGDIWYDVSLVDGYSLPAEIIPSVQIGSCVTTDCHISLAACPINENYVGDLRLVRNGRTIKCLAPCKRWNYPHPYGLGMDELIHPGVMLCCPTPPIWPEECRAGLVVNTQYVQLVHRDCPTAYAYSYDDEAGLHNCPNNTTFKVTFCHNN